MSQVETLSAKNAQLVAQNTDAQRRIVSLEMMSDEYGKVSKSLADMKIECDMRKSEMSQLVAKNSALEEALRVNTDISTTKIIVVQCNLSLSMYYTEPEHDREGRHPARVQLRDDQVRAEEEARRPQATPAGSTQRQLAVFLY